MSSTKYDVEKFCGKGNFSLWQRRMKDLLIQKGVHKALLGKEKKSETMKDVEWVEIDEKAASAIRLNLGDEVIHNILEAKTAKEVWEKLKGLYNRTLLLDETESKSAPTSLSSDVSLAALANSRGFFPFFFSFKFSFNSLH